MSFRILEAGRCPLRVAGRPAFWPRFHTACLRPTCVLVQGRRTLAHQDPGCVPLTRCFQSRGGRPIPCPRNGRAPHPIPGCPPAYSLPAATCRAPGFVQGDVLRIGSGMSFRATSCAWKAVWLRATAALRLRCVLVAVSFSSVPRAYQFLFFFSLGPPVPPSTPHPDLCAPFPLPSLGHDPVRPSLHLAFKKMTSCSLFVFLNPKQPPAPLKTLRELGISLIRLGINSSQHF